MKANPRLGIAMVLMAAALWGTTGTSQALTGGAFTSYWFGAFRIAIATAFFAAYAALTARGAGLFPARLPLGTVAIAGACMAAYNLAFFAGVRLVGVGLGTAIALGSGPIWAGVLQALIAGRRPAGHWWAGTVLAITGGVLMTGIEGSGPRAGALGVGLCLLSGLSYAGYSLVVKRLASAAPASQVTLSAFGIAALLAVPAAWLDAPLTAAQVQQWSAVNLLGLAYVGVVTAGVSYLLFSNGLKHISAATAVTLALAEMLTAFLLAVLLLHEPQTPLAFWGVALVIAGVLLVVRAELRAGAAGASLKTIHAPRSGIQSEDRREA